MPEIRPLAALALDVQMPGDLQRPGMLLICPVDSHKCGKLDFLFPVRVYHLLKASCCVHWILQAALVRESYIANSVCRDQTTSEDSFWNKAHPATRNLVNGHRNVTRGHS